MSWETALTNHLRRRMQVELEIPLPEPDVDGDFRWIPNGGPVMWFRISGQPPIVRLWSVAAHEIRPSVAVLRELNDWNCHHVLARAVWREDPPERTGDVVVSLEAELATLESGQLGRYAKHVLETAMGLGEALAVTCGARLHWLPAEESAGSDGVPTDDDRPF